MSPTPEGLVLVGRRCRPGAPRPRGARRCRRASARRAAASAPGRTPGRRWPPSVRWTSPTPPSGAGPTRDPAPRARPPAAGPRGRPRARAARPRRRPAAGPARRLEPGEVVVHAHRAAHHDQTAHVAERRRLRDGLAAVEAHDARGRRRRRRWPGRARPGPRRARAGAPPRDRRRP